MRLLCIVWDELLKFRHTTPPTAFAFQCDSIFATSFNIWKILFGRPFVLFAIRRDTNVEVTKRSSRNQAIIGYCSCTATRGIHWPQPKEIIPNLWRHGNDGHDRSILGRCRVAFGTKPFPDGTSFLRPQVVTICGHAEVMPTVIVDGFKDTMFTQPAKTTS